jgi:hypothetical protein
MSSQRIVAILRAVGRVAAEHVFDLAYGFTLIIAVSGAVQYFTSAL